MIGTEIRSLGSKEIESGQKILDAMQSAGMKVRAALWVYSPEGATWSMMVAMPEVDSKGPIALYLKLNKILSALSDPGISSIDVVLVSPRDYRIRDLRRFFHSEGTTRPRPINTSWGGDTYVYTA